MGNPELDLEHYRGKYTCGQEILLFDWRLGRDHVYKISGKLC